MIKKPKRTGTFFVYILKCRDGTFYTGYTNDLENRIKEHNKGKRGAKYTRGRGPVDVVYVKGCKSKGYAMRAEALIKKLTRMRKKELIMAAPTDFSF